MTTPYFKTYCRFTPSASALHKTSHTETQSLPSLTKEKPSQNMYQLLEDNERGKERQEPLQTRRKRLWLRFLLVASIAHVLVVTATIRAPPHPPAVAHETSDTAELRTNLPKAIASTQELYDVVDLWLNGSFTSDSVWAATYGYPIGKWDVSQVTDFSFLFAACYRLCEDEWHRNSRGSKFSDDISMWNVSSAKNMSYMFSNARSFHGNISKWNVANVADMSYMFYKADSFIGNISQWNVSNVVDMSYMFYDADSFNRDLSQWNVANVMKMRGMFSNAETFNSHLSRWNVSNVKDMSNYFSPVEDMSESEEEFEDMVVSDEEFEDMVVSDEEFEDMVVSDEEFEDMAESEEEFEHE